MKKFMKINNKINKDKHFDGQRLSSISTIGLIFLMLVYLFVTITGSMKLSDQIDIISDHPFEVVISTSDIQTYLAEMSLRTNRLLPHHSSEDIEQAESALDDLYVSVETPYLKLKELYLGDQSDIEALEDTLKSVKREQTAFLSYMKQAGNSDRSIETYVAEHLQPLYDKVSVQTEDIITKAQQKKVGYGKQANDLRWMMTAGSIVLMTFMIWLLLFSQHVLRRQRKELLYRSKLFDDLSLSIDDTFMIRDALTGEINYRSLNMNRVLGISENGSMQHYQGLKPEDALEMRDSVLDPNFESPYEKLVEYTDPNGEKRWVLIHIYKTTDTSHPQFISVYSDRTKEIAVQQALEVAMLGAERSSLAKSEFLSRMSHEIRTPLNAIIGMTTIAAASTHDPAKIEDCLSKITFSSKHLLMLINDVLDMSKIESNKIILQNETFDIFEIINGFVSTVYAQAKAKQIDFTEKMLGFQDSSVYIGDSLRLNQILLNLSSNAVKFTPPGGSISLNVSLLSSRNKVDVLRFVLTDTGIGMSQDAVDRIFEPFEQADATIAKRYGGTGLGMSITKNLIELMNGTIEIKSTLGKGTTCIVDIPFKRAAENIQQPDFSNQRLRALVVDDEQQVCDQTIVLLGKIKIDAEYALSGQTAIRQVKAADQENRLYDICLIDWKMPDMNGIECTRQIRKEVGDDVPIVMISAYDISKIENEARRVGVNGFLPKPLYRSSVYTAIKEALQKKTGNQRSTTEGPLRYPLAGKHLLLAEDNSLNQEIAMELLKMHGAEVECVDNGQEAVDRFLASKPGDLDAILMDVQMPVMDGHEAARQIRKSTHPMAMRIPIIATTANAFGDDISAALAAGMNAHISKPLDMEKLCALLLELIKDAQKGGNENL